MSNTVLGVVLFCLGTLAAIYIGCLSLWDGTAEYCIEFAIASIFAVIGWQEIGPVDEIGQGS